MHDKLSEIWELGLAFLSVMTIVTIGGIATLILLTVCNPLAWIAGILYWLHSIGLF